MKTQTSMDGMYRLLVQGVKDYAIYMLALDGTVSNWNSGAQRFKGYCAEEIVGEHFSKFYTAEDRALGLPQRALDRALAEERFEGEGWRVRKDGSRFWAHVVLDLICDDDGQHIGFAKITRDMTEQRENAKKMFEQESSFRLLIQGVTDYAIYMLTPEGLVSNWNAGAERLKGYQSAEIVGKHFSHFYQPEDRKKGLPQRALAKALAGGKFEGEGWRLRKNGSRFWAHVVIDPIYHEDGHLVGFAKITRDLTEFKRQIDEAETVKSNLDLALSNMSQGLCLFDEHEQLVLCNTRFEEIIGLEAGTTRPGSTLVDLLWSLHGNDTMCPDAIAKQVAESRVKHLEMLGKPGELVSVEQAWGDRTLAVSHRALERGGWVSTYDDITERKRIETQISHLALHDSLTALPNRASLRQMLATCLEAKLPCALLYMDLDRFKPVNDTLGHSAGDRVLQVVAERIGAQLRKNDFGARLGGDEFAILLPGCDTYLDAGGVADRLIREIARPIHLDELEVNVGGSVGIAFSPKHGVDADLLLRNADLALYSAKQAGRGCHRLYEDGMERQLEERRELERDLRDALVGGEFSLHYQPVIDVKHNVVTSFEALLRWNSPKRGSVSPAEFIPFAEEIGFMSEIGDWVLRTACTEAATWQEQIGVSVNLSPTQFRQPDLVEKIAAVLEETGLLPSRLELEITETAMIDDLARAGEVLNALRERGIQIAMDDFGTGYSSLSFLRNLPFTRIKIDRSFIQDLGRNPEALAIIRAVTSLCDGLGVSATAEGVETKEQMSVLRAEGCSEIQGYLIGRPSAAPEAKAWLMAYQKIGQTQPQPVLMSA